MQIRMWIFAVLISIFYAVGLELLGYSLLSMKRSAEAAHWPTAVGNLLMAEL